LQHPGEREGGEQEHRELRDFATSSQRERTPVERPREGLRQVHDGGLEAGNFAHAISAGSSAAAAIEEEQAE